MQFKLGRDWKFSFAPLAGQNLFPSRKRVVSRSTKTGVSFTTTWRNEHWNAGAPKKPAQAVAAALVEQMGCRVFLPPCRHDTEIPT
jgi:hypothetical protein